MRSAWVHTYTVACMGQVARPCSRGRVTGFSPREIGPLTGNHGFGYPNSPASGYFYAAGHGNPGSPTLITATDDMNLYGLLLVLLGVLPVLLIGRDGFRGVPVASKVRR